MWPVVDGEFDHNQIICSIEKEEEVTISVFIVAMVSRSLSRVANKDKICV